MTGQLGKRDYRVPYCGKTPDQLSQRVHRYPGAHADVAGEEFDLAFPTGSTPYSIPIRIESLAESSG